MPKQHWLDTPASIEAAFEFSIRIHEAKMRGLRIDGGAALAVTAADNLLRTYFDRMTTMAKDGHFDPDHIMEGLTFQMGDIDGEEENET